MTTLIPAYGRDYKSKAAAVADWEAGKDFEVVDLFSGSGGKYASRSDFPKGSTHNLRYGKLRKVIVVVASLALAYLAGCSLSSQFTVAGQYGGQEYSYSVLAK